MTNTFILKWNDDSTKNVLETNGSVSDFVFKSTTVGLGSPLSWHSMHSRYIIANGQMDVSINLPDDNPNNPNSAVIPNQSATILKFNNPNSDLSNIMIWTPYKQNINYKNLDNMIWDFSLGNISPTIYESSYVGIDYLLNTGTSFKKLNTTVTDISKDVASNKSDITDLSKNLDGSLSNLISRITAIEQFLGGTTLIKGSEDHIKNYYLGLSEKPPTTSTPINRWNEISNNSVWRQFL